MTYRIRALTLCMTILNELKTLLGRERVYSGDLIKYFKALLELAEQGAKEIELEEVQLHNLKIRRDYHKLHVNLHTILKGKPFADRDAGELLDACTKITDLVHVFIKKWENDSTVKIKYFDSLIAIAQKTRKSELDKKRLEHIRGQIE